MNSKNAIKLLVIILAFLVTACVVKDDDLRGPEGSIPPSQEGPTASNGNKSGISEKAVILNPEGVTVQDRIRVPEGFERIPEEENSFAYYLRNLPVKPDGVKVSYYDGKTKGADVHVAVIDMEIGDRDLQQCADAVIRLRAEYLYAQGRFNEIHFNFTNGFRADYGKWMEGQRIAVDGNKVSWVKKTGYSNDYQSFRKYLNMVFAYAGTLSLSQEMVAVPLEEMRIGDVFIQGGSPGHCVMVMDMAQNKKTGEKRFLLAQSYMPAQDIHILKNFNDGEMGPWYSLDFGDTLHTPEWTFSKEDLKRFDDENSDSIAKQIDQMTLNEKIGQLVVVGLDGYSINDKAREMIKEHHVGGFILYKKNVRDAQQLVDLINSLKDANSENNIPLFISVDEEGGKITRMPEKIKRIPANGQIGKIADEKLSFEIGGLLADELKAFGFNMNFAPVLDINSNPRNPVIGERAFGSDKEIVTRLGIQTMKGMQSKGIIPVIKHFPGHGDTSVDSHIGLPRVDHGLERLKQFELIPFAQAIENGVDAVMVAHILFPEIDPKNPSTLSSTIITDILKKDMRFKGVVITDDMTMGAIMKNYSIGDAVVQSVLAGSDIVLVCHEYQNEVEAIKALKDAVDNGLISQERIDESVYKILRLKAKYKLKDQWLELPDVEELNKKIDKVLKMTP